MGLRWYEHKAASMFMTSGKCRGHLDSLVHRGWADIWHLPLWSLNQVCCRACRAPGQQDRCRSKSSLEEYWPCVSLWSQGCSVMGAPPHTPVGGLLSQAAVGNACSACRGTGPPSRRMWNAATALSFTGTVRCERQTGQEPLAVGSMSSLMQARPCHPDPLSPSGAYSDWIFSLGLYLQGVIGKGQILFIWFGFFLREK